MEILADGQTLRIKGAEVGQGAGCSICRCSATVRQFFALYWCVLLGDVFAEGLSFCEKDLELAEAKAVNISKL